MKVTVLFVFFMVLSVVYAQNGATVYREVQETASTGDVITVKLSVLNPYSDERTFSVEEKLPNDIVMIEPAEPHETRFFNGIKVSFLKWESSIKPGSVKSFEYKMRLNTPGEYSLSPTKVIDLKSGLDARSESSNIIVSCLPNGVCDENENYLNCNQDCIADALDGVCNPAPGLCDPDCEGGEKCTRGEGGFSLWYILIPIVLIGIIFLIYKT